MEKQLLPLYIQAADRVCLEIKKDNFREGERIPRMNQLSRILKINTSAMEKGLLYLVDREILGKKSPLEYYVQKGAKLRILKEAQEEFWKLELPAFLREAERIGITKEKLIAHLNGSWEEEDKDDDCNV